MPGTISRLTVCAIVAAAFAFACVPTAAQAGDFENQRVGVISVPNAPVTAARCKTGVDWYFVFVNIVNRSRHALLGGTVEFRYYDGDGVLIGQHRTDFSENPPIASGDQAVNQFNDSYVLSEPASAIARATCKVVAAQFTGLKKWTDTQKWGEPLVPMQQQQSSQAAPSQNGPTAQNGLPSPPQFAISVANAWNDHMDGNLIVHVAVDVQGGNSVATLTPNMLMLTMLLANGERKTYAAMTTHAPYREMTINGVATYAREVDPKDDLGGLGSVIVPAHGTVRMTATFLVGTDVVADPNANRQVALQ